MVNSIYWSLVGVRRQEEPPALRVCNWCTLQNHTGRTTRVPFPLQKIYYIKLIVTCSLLIYKWIFVAFYRFLKALYQNSFLFHLCILKLFRLEMLHKMLIFPTFHRDPQTLHLHVSSPFTKYSHILEPHLSAQAVFSKKGKPGLSVTCQVAVIRSTISEVHLQAASHIHQESKIC